jgi:pimeloyl-ACP methyl ester carboxylesterase
MTAATRYAKSGDVHVAYQVTGSGAQDLVLVPGFVSHLEADWESPVRARLLDRLGSFCRLIRFDKRGTGLSDRGPIPSLEQRMEDVRAVMDAAGSARAAMFAHSEGGPMALLFAATYPERVTRLCIYGSYARRVPGPDYPYGPTPEQRAAFLARLEAEWGQGAALDVFAPTLAGNAEARAQFASYQRQAASPGAALEVMRMNGEIDVRAVLPAVHVPTLILHRTQDRLTEVGHARYMAARLPGAVLKELPGEDHLWNAGDADAIVDEIAEFLTGARHCAASDAVLATVLFTDIVGSTQKAAALGDRAWRDLLAQHQALVRRKLAEFRGREVNTAGDGFLASFDGPARGVRCARAIVDASRDAGIELRAGLHTGECEVLGDNLSGLAVHIGARIAAQAGAGEVLVSGTLKDLVAGSGLRFADRGVHALKGVPGEWRILALDG